MIDIDKLKKRLMLLGNGSDFELRDGELWITDIDPYGLSMSAYGVECNVHNSKLRDIKNVISVNIMDSKITGELGKIGVTTILNSEICSECTYLFRAMDIINSKITLTKPENKESSILLLRLRDSEITLKGIESFNFALDTLVNTEYEALLFMHNSVLRTDNLELYNKLVDKFRAQEITDRVAEIDDRSRLEFIG